MLQIRQVTKRYKTGDLVQMALNNVSLNLRDNEFVAILGPSGSGKTTLLNVMGGLDRYDSGDLIINGISTKQYRDRDWDSYRNHTIGFVFQSYNLIPHQSVLANVELALTISGVSRGERKRRARRALEQVGLGDQLHKRPNQMSGGQMQRVAIARALVNDPDILLADEPTGALDTDTSTQVMELLKEVAKDRLVVMVTHNPELAEQYATRIVRLRDGNITDDSDPYKPDGTSLPPPKHKTMGKASMGFPTALSLSFNNLRTKKGRTVLTAFAGSIGIIGIALILSLSNGVKTYITDIQKTTMTAYPISIEATAVDMSSVINAVSPVRGEDAGHDLDAVYSNGKSIEAASTMTSSFRENDLTAFKKYLDDPESPIKQYVGENGIVYSYAAKFSVYGRDPDGKLVNTDGSTLEEGAPQESLGMTQGMSRGPMMFSQGNLEELVPGKGDTVVSTAISDSYDVLWGAWPSKWNEVVLVLDENNEISTHTLYELGILPASEYKTLLEKIENGEKVTLQQQKWSYEKLATQRFLLLPACDAYLENTDGTYRAVSGTGPETEQLLEDAVQLEISGIIRPKKDAPNASILAPLGYTRLLTDYLIDHAEESAVVKAQQAHREINVLNGIAFQADTDEEKAEDAKTYLSHLGISDKAAFYMQMVQSDPAANPAQTAQLSQMGEAELAQMLDAYLASPNQEWLVSVYDTSLSGSSYNSNLEAFGIISRDAPSAISIYTDSFEDKNAISDCIEAYNRSAEEDSQITYTDYVALLMSSVTTIINVISYVLIAFVAVSLAVSSIMIGIITYISVLERTKEIGLLRAIGASKRNISQVFNAETFIIGLLSGLIGIGVSLLLLIPGNAVIHMLTGSVSVNASLPLAGAAILVVLSVILTLLGGLIPSKKASKRDPVTALRTE